ncbi:PREDICTED: LOW QUALITY PROTEIN: DNA-dependent protein kinase catalytic subunit-like [Dufourea novaeangliae]|uniref:LOW QUALITY PROTEIN: DNA-dependent protein kinase catalytic subunit-like n=1 Tax=Dufourea novaeangliae TaxID=178035 RepID=UPI0007675306|nr:PREDICTED: LOW QUALITY PROTEIN: DNA-dependent protein kinase catalytic subunit-like [Dufourea novaeangliae]
MDSFKTFMDIFTRSVREISDQNNKDQKSSSNLIQILRDSRKYFQNILKDDSELVLSILFDKEEGLLCFLNNALKKSTKPQRDFDTAIKEAYHLLEFVIEQFSEIFVPYVIDTKNICQQALETKCSLFIQRAASNAFNKLIDLLKEYEMELGETIKRFVSLFPIVDIKERSVLFLVIGEITKHNPEIPEVKEYSTMIFQQLRNDIIKQYNPQTVSQSADIFQVYLDVLSNLLGELSCDLKQKYCKELYGWVKDLSRPERYQVKKVSMRSAVNLLSRHIYLFCEFVYCDYKHWYNLLVNLAQDKNLQCSECGQHALKSFYRMIGNTLKYKTSEEDKAVFLYFKNLLEEQLKSNQQANTNILRFIIYGFSQMAAPCKRYLTDNNVREMFSLIAHCAVPLYSREDLGRLMLESTCDYQEALSEIILHTSDLSIDQINIILKLSIILIKRFPDLPVTSRSSAISSLIHTIINVGIVSKTLLEEFLYNLIQDGIIWSCSHTLFIDAELQRGLQNLGERPVCYKNYLPLWLQLLKLERYKQHQQILQVVVDSMIHVSIVLISKLNLNTKTKEDNIFSDVAFSQIGENNEDFRMFVNIVDLYVDIISELESSLLINTLHKFLLKIIGMSYKRPLISGFYKLVYATFKHISNLLNDEIETETLELLYKYLMNILNLISTFSGELLTTCLSLILNVPEIYIKRILNSTIPTFKIALTVGLSDFEIAYTALNTLEKWTSHLNNRQTDKFLREIVPLLEPYLHSGESCVEFLQDIIKTERKVIKRVILRDDENTLERFQMRILLFIASLDTDIIMNFVYKRSMDTGATWDKKDLLKYSLMLSDTEVDVYFDKILPRLTQLAQNSGDRRTKIIACEVLHSVIVFIVGKTSTSNMNRFAPVYKIICPALLSLGCDLDEAASKIFHPLTLQLIHWLSSQFMLNSLATTYFVDSLFESLNNDSNSSLREFSGMCLAEFTKWSIKQSDNKKKIQLNIDGVIYKITNFALHPSVSKRVAAITAFNHLYIVLREDEEIVSEYWLELLYCFVKSLDGCNDPSIKTALEHVERVLIAKMNLLNAEDDKRRKPYDFEGSTLTDAVYWLLTQCGGIDQYYRAKCMELVVKLSKHITNCDSAKAMINNYINTHGIETFNAIILKGLKSKIDSLSFKAIAPLLRSLDCYIWLIRNDLLTVQYLFANSNSEREVIFNCARNFIHVVNQIKIETKDDDSVMLSKELEELQILHCKLIMTLFDFLQVLLNFDENYIPDFFLNKDLFELIAKCIMCPEVIGFDTKNFEISEALPLVMENLLKSIIRKNDDTLLSRVKHELSVHVEKHTNNFIDMDNIVFGKESCNELKQYVRGLSFLEQHDIFNRLYNGTQLIDHPEDKIGCIFKVLAQKRMDVFVCVNIKAPVKDYLRILIELLLIHYEPTITRTLITLITTNTILGSDLNKIEHGIYFLNMFKNEIFRYMLKDIEKTIEVFDDLLQANPPFLLTITEQVFVFVQRHKNELHECKQKLISIYGIAVHLKDKPTEVLSLSKDFYTWILNQLTESSDIEYKIKILQNFLVCLTDMTCNTRPELLVILHTLRSHRLDMCPNDFAQRNVKALKIINCFQTLLKLLAVTKSVVLFKTIILFTAGIAEQLCNETTDEYLRKYFNSITTEYALESIETAYKLFMNSNTSIDERFDILRKFLLPLFHLSKIHEICKFFERNIKEIYTIVQQVLIGSSSDMKQLIVSKIGCYDLVAVMFGKIPLKEIDNPESVITRNAIDNVVTGKELLRNLYRSALNVRMLKTPDPEHKEIIRLLHCSAYNCSIAIVSLKTDEDSYLSIFLENRKKKQLIWENIVDCRKQYNLQQTFKEYPKYRKKLTTIRKSMRSRQSSARYSYIYSYNVGTCTLNEDINAYDFNEATVRNNSNNADTAEESMSLLFESDELNNHECMGYICGVLNHMISEEISTLPDDSNIVMPEWLKYFCKSMTSTSYDNVRLFMLKIILNTQTVFKPYAKFFLQPIIHTTYSYLRQNQLNYVIADVIEMLIDWRTVAVPDENHGKTMAQKLWEIIIEKAMVKKTSEISKAVYKYNMIMIKTILETWNACLQLPQNLTNKMKTLPGAAVYLILICMVNGMEKHVVEKDDIFEFLKKSLEDWKDDEETILQCCECFGLILKHLDESNSQSNKKGAIIDKIQSIFRQMQTTFVSRQIKCIRALCKSYQNAGMIYFEFVTANIFRVDRMGQSHCLEIFLQCIPKLGVDLILKELAHMKFRDLLRNKVSLCEKIALQIIDSLVPILPPSNFLPLLNLVPLYTKHDSSEYRECAYDIFMNVYKRYSIDTSDDENVRELVYNSREMLLSGILENLNTYTANVGNNFLPFLLLMILDLTKKSTKYMQKMFDGPLYDCRYRDYNITPSWRIKNFGSKAPLFVPSLATQMNQTFIQMSATLANTNFDSTNARTSAGFNAELNLQATQELEFEPTYVSEKTVLMSSDYDHDNIFKVPIVPQPAHNKRSKRFLNSSTEISTVIRQKEIKNNIQRDEMIKEEAARQRSSVKLYRKYRIGDFPDVEISHSALIEPLQQLVKKDLQICKDLTVCIICSLVKEHGGDEFVKKVASSLKLITQTEQGSSSIIAAILEILLTTRVVNCSPEIIAKVSRLNNLHFLGSLVIEENLIHGINDFQPSKKKARYNAVQESNEWLQLTNLYESMNDVDVVLSIFQNHITNEDMREASFAQAGNNWIVAKQAYEKAYESGSELVKEHCLQGLFESLSNLCRWDEIDKRIQNKLNGNIDNIWNEPWKDWMFPWLFEVHVRKLTDEDINDTFSEAVKIMEDWLKDDVKVKHIKRFFGNELSMFFLYNELEVAHDFILNTLDETREQWIRLHPLSTQLRIRNLRKLRITSNINWFIKVLKTVKNPHGLQEILKFWNNSLPSVQDAILPSDKLTSCRIYFIQSPLNDRLELMNETQHDSESVPDREGSGITNQLHTVAFNMRLKMIDAALNQKNKYIAKKYLHQLEREVPNYSEDMKHQFFLTGAKIKYLNGEIETNMKKKLSNYASSWKHCHNLLQENYLDSMTNVGVRQQVSKIASKVAQLTQKDETFFNLLMRNTMILNAINSESDDPSVIKESLETYSLNQLKMCCDTTTASIQECYFTLSKYCYDRLLDGTSSISISKEFVHSTLKAMSYGSLDAAHYFPCLLKPEYFEDEETKDIFLKESEGVETWLFLSWQAQLFSHLGTSIAPLIIPILKRIVEIYPNAVIYTFRLTVETNPALLNKTRTYEIRQILYNRPENEQFLLAIQYVAQPELYLHYYLLEFLQNLSLGPATAVDILLKKVYTDTLENECDPKPGKIFNEIQCYRAKIKEWERKKPDEIKQHVDQIIKELTKLLETRRDRLHLQDYSPWLYKYSEKDIEIPGQYTGNRKPMPQYHAKIMKIEPTVKVMQSLRKPIQIIMVGNDAKEYPFLVKFGEDLRQDQRLQQLCTIMNKTLHTDAACRQRQLSIDTYQVIPLSKTVGLIQWIDDTRSLEDLIHFTLSEEQIKKYKLICKDYDKWIRSAAPSKNQIQRYKEATVKYSASKVSAKMNEFISKTEWDSLRKTFTVLCPSVESFLTMRRNFITTYATMCIAHWILGIGDRHFRNILITIGSGHCLGIDFGLAFDAGVDLRIPELVPFRLTHQILGLLKPFTEKDLLGAIMIHTLRALRNESGPILSCMDVFVHEPLNWTDNVNKALREDEDDIADVKWIPMKKIKAVTKKLNGIKPSLITLEQLKEHHDDKYFHRYNVIVTGDDEIKRTRATMKNDLLTPEEQIECLLDQATDLNILGRSYVGWQPWL